MFYLSQPIAGFINLTSQLFSGRVSNQFISGAGQTVGQFHTFPKPRPFSVILADLTV